MNAADSTATILVVEDDAATRTYLADNLCADGYELLVAGTVHEALELAGTRFPDLAIVDLGLPDASGLDLVAAIRSADGVASRVDPALPIVVLSGRAGELDRLRGFERGCDDYLAKPFSYPELRARVAALLRRADRRGRSGRLRVGDLEVDVLARTVRLRGVTVGLSQKEFALLRALASEPTRVFTKEELLRSIWGYRSRGTTRTLDSHACRLRQKLGAHGDRFIVNVWGVGYRLVDGPAVAEPARAPEPAAAFAAIAPVPLLAAHVGSAALTLAWVVAAIAVGLAIVSCAALRRRRELVARACHELRGPLMAAHLALHAGARHGEAPAARLKGIDLELRRAGMALDDLAAARRGRRAADRDEPVDVGDLLAFQALTWRAVAPVFGCELDVVEPGPRTVVRGDRIRLAQAVGNLVANALEHGTGRVELAGRRQGDRVRIEVADEGPGLPAPVAQLVRRPRAGRGRRGRGLAIAAEIVARHGGRLVAAPSTAGARVAIELPAARAVL
ncbi:MAG: hybrid sensor histidine kinase/response regulator [Solirubrobacteraceae bacterium]